MDTLKTPLVSSDFSAPAAYADDKSLPYVSTGAKQPVRLRMNVTGTGSDVGSRPPTTVFQEFTKTVERHGGRIALTRSDGLKTWTWRQYYDSCHDFAKSCVKVGLVAGDGVNIIGFNSPEWYFADFGGIMAGGIAAGVYTTNGPDSCHYQAEHSDASVVVVEGREQLAKYLRVKDRLPKLKAIVVYNPDEGMTSDTTSKVPVYLWDDFIRVGASVPSEDVAARMRAQTPGHCCTLIYTSGTTGPPKAVMISHDNITFTAAAIMEDISLSCEDVMVSYLPLSHIAAQMIDMQAAMMAGYSIYFAKPDALKGSITTTLQAAKPTIFFGVPRVWEKIQEKMVAVGRGATGMTLKIKDWAKAKGMQHAMASQYGSTAPEPGCFGCANSLVFSKVRKALGLERMRLAYSAAAPITKETIDFFAALNIHIMEIFGQSECTGPCTLNFPGSWKIGTVGVVLPGTVVKIVPETQEITYTGRHIFMGYLKMDKETDETIDSEGYLHSGDQGAFDADHFMRITGRIKELLKTSGGENIPPVLIENSMKKHMPFLSNVVVVGDKRNYLTALVTLKVFINTETNIPTRDLFGDAKHFAKTIGSDAVTTEQAVADPKWMEAIMKGVAKANSEAVSRAAYIQKVKILLDDFSEPTGELTPTLKLKRREVYKKYPAEIDALYA